MNLRDHQSRAGRGNKGKPKSPAHRAKLANILELARAKKRRQARDLEQCVDSHLVQGGAAPGRAHNPASAGSTPAPATTLPTAAPESHPGSPNPQRRRGHSTTTARRTA